MSNHYKTLDSKSKSRLSKDQSEIIGFINGWGESNCFLNSALQVLYHLLPFRQSLKTYKSCSQSRTHYCLVCGLKEIFTTYSSQTSSSKLSPIDITKFRSELASKYTSKNLFAINEPADSMEALSAILSSFHSDSESLCSENCPAHSMFRLHIEESLICECGAKKTDLWDMNTFSQHFYVNDIFEETKGIDQYELLKVKENDFEQMMAVSNVIKFESRLQEYINSQWALSVSEMCPNECKIASSKKELVLRKAPKVFAVNLIWRDFNPRLNKILQILASISYTVSLDSIYLYSGQSMHTLKSTILYGRGHYICAIRLGPNKLWYKIDDERDRLIGKGSWIDLVQDCLSNRYYPVGLFYEESPKREDTHIAPTLWIELERKVLDFLKNSDDCDEGEDWICECGQANNAHWTYCNICKRLKPGLSGWICTACTFVNKTEHAHCRSCGEKKKNDNSRCLCGKPKCVCVKMCEKCGEKYSGKCEKCFSGKYCFVCQEEVTRVESRVCFLCKGETDGRRCTVCEVLIEQRVCGKCLKGLKQCRKCKRFCEEDAIKCAYVKCKNLFGMYETFSGSRMDESVKNGERKEWKCELCDKKYRDSDKKFCKKCLESKKKCAECLGKNWICEECFKSKKKCEMCGEFYCVGEKCGNAECATNHIESSPNRIEEKNGVKGRSCRMCEKNLPGFGFCLECKLKIRSERCPLCMVGVSHEFCESCVQYTKSCTDCKKQMHITHERCINCS